jgi:CRISPR-associated protein Cmr6
MEYPIPNHSSTAYLNYRNQSKTVLNAGLIFDRYTPGIQDSTSKKEGLSQAISAAEKADLQLLKSQASRWKEIAATLLAVPFTLKTDWRLVAGLGHKGALEVGFTFNRYGFPILPGSSLKGVARTYALITLAEMLSTPKLVPLEEDLIKTEQDFLSALKSNFPTATVEAQQMAVQFRKIFGTADSTGQAIFLDGIPEGNELPKLELDVMTSHYSQYYQGKSVPSDNQDPVPNLFLTVAAQTPFLFAVGWRTGQDADEKRFQELAVEWLSKGLQSLGAGAKTSAGYGFFVPGNQTSKALPPGYRRGTVQTFGEGPHQSYGFIRTDNGEEFFVHRNQLSEGISELQPGQKVFFKVKFEKGRPQAQDVHLE